METVSSKKFAAYAKRDGVAAVPTTTIKVVEPVTEPELALI